MLVKSETIQHPRSNLNAAGFPELTDRHLEYQKLNSVMCSPPFISQFVYPVCVSLLLAKTKFALCFS